MDKIKQMNLFLKIITFGWARAITLAPFGIYIKKEYLNDYKVIAKEKLHWVQQTSLFYLPFYIWYIGEWLIRIFINGRKAYRCISFEREVEDNWDNLVYPEIRTRFAFLKYLK